MKIAIVRQKYVNYGGAENFVSEYTTHLANAGHDIHIFANQWVPSSHSSIRVHPVRAIKLSSFLRTLSFSVFALQAVRSDQFDIIQSHERLWTQDVYRAGDGCHREWLERRANYSSSFKKLSFRFNLFHQLVLRLEKKIFESGQCKKIIAISEMVKRDILKHYKLSEGRIEVVYNGVSLDRFHPDNKNRFRKEVRKRLGISDTEVMVLFVGSGFERKGLRYLLKALPYIKKNNWRLVLVGKGNWESYLSLLSEANKKKVTHLNPIDNIETLFASADFFVLPSIYEPFGNANLEALAAGLPIITSRNCGAAEIITSKKEGIVLKEPSDAKAIAGAIDYLMDFKVRKPMAQAARFLAEQFTQERNATEMLKIYEKII